MKFKLPDHVLATINLRLFGFTKIPLVLFVRPSVLQINDEISIVRIPFRRRTKNHLGSMYFGAMAIGAELAAGIIAMKLIRNSKRKISIVFKNFTGDFIKRAEGHTYFICEDGEKIKKLVEQAIKSDERVEETINVVATVPTKMVDEPVAKFSLTVSLKGKKQ